MNPTTTQLSVSVNLGHVQLCFDRTHCGGQKTTIHLDPPEARKLGDMLFKAGCSSVPGGVNAYEWDADQDADQDADDAE